MNDGSRNLDFPADDMVSQTACVELSQGDPVHVAHNEAGIQDRPFISIYAPPDTVVYLNDIMKKTGVAYRINDYRACQWSKNDVLCYFRYESLNSFQKILLQDAKAQRAVITPLISYFEQHFGLIEIDLLGPEQLIEMDTKPAALVGRKWSLRGGFERLFALCALVFLMPVGLLVALLIKWDSTGPVFFQQLRTGLYNREFKIVKFRSMTVDAEQHGARWAAQNDNRVTRVGSFLRKTRIDELPQLINVIRGDMAIIGPRPEREVFISQLEHKIPYYRFRHLVKPGITGLAQVMYGYGASVDDARQKHRYDLYYIKHKGAWLDCKILWQTLQIVVTGKGV